MRALVIGAAVLAIASAAVPATRGGGHAVLTCKPSETVVWLALQGDSTAGSSYVTLDMTNLSHHACTLYGFPGVSAVDLSGRQVGAAAGRDPATTPRDVRLAPGQQRRHSSGSRTSGCSQQPRADQSRQPACASICPRRLDRGSSRSRLAPAHARARCFSMSERSRAHDGLGHLGELCRVRSSKGRVGTRFGTQSPFGQQRCRIRSALVGFAIRYEPTRA